MVVKAKSSSHDAVHTMRMLRANSTDTLSGRSSDGFSSSPSDASTSSRSMSLASIRRKRRIATRKNTPGSSQDEDDDEDDEALAAPGQVGRPVDDWPQPIGYRAVLLQQMLSRFLQVYFPDAAVQFDVDLDSMSYLFLLPSMDLTAYPLLNHAASVVCYAHFGTINKDFRLQLESRQHYASAVALLRREVSRKTPAIQPWIVIISIMLLAMFDDATKGTRSTSTDWITHYEGALAYVQAVGPSHFGMSISRAFQLAKNLIGPDLYLGMANRKAPVFAQPRWTKVFSGSWQDFATASFLTPQILQRVEDALRNPQEQELVATCEEIVQLRSHIRIHVPTDLPRSNLVDLFATHGFDATTEEHLFLTTNSTFEPYYGDASPDAVPIGPPGTFGKARPWMHLLMLDCALLRVYHFHPELAVREGDDVRPDIHSEAFEAASSLCRLLWALTHQNGSQPMTHSADWLIHLAEHYFEEVEATQELGWCQGARLAINLHLRRLQSTQPPTLCRLGDLTDALAKLTSFRAPITEGTPKQISREIPHEDYVKAGAQAWQCPHANVC